MKQKVALYNWVKWRDSRRVNLRRLLIIKRQKLPNKTFFMEYTRIKVDPELSQLPTFNHQVTHIIEVKLSSSVNEQSNGQTVVDQRETLFLAVFGCPCCSENKEYLTKV